MLSRSKRRWATLSLLGIPLIGAVVLVACSDAMSGDPQLEAPVLQVRVVNSYPHDPGAFCQGLVVEGETLYEGTGQYGNSTLRQVDLETGKVQAYQRLNAQYFGEGIAIHGDRIYQLTWKERTCVVWEKATLKALGVFNYAGQGWGLASDGKQLFMSDGSSSIRIINPADFSVIGKLRVKDGRRAISKLNELEYIEGFLYANIWYDDRVAKIDPKTGKVVAWIDCRGVYPANIRPSREHVLNGIAYDAEQKRIFLTGKNWPRLFEVEILEDTNESDESSQATTSPPE